MATLERDNNIENPLDLTIRLIGFQINSLKNQSYAVFTETVWLICAMLCM